MVTITSTILTGDALEMLKTIESGTVNTCVTSPPYYGLRQYLPAGSMVIKNSLTKNELDYLTAELERLGITDVKG